MTWIEVAGFATGALCVYLVVRENIWNFPIGIANNVFFFVLFIQTGLYADAGLQIVYLGLAALGWRWWLHGGPNRTGLRVRHAGKLMLIVSVCAVSLGTLIIYWLLTEWTDSKVAIWDALTTAMSLTAQWMLSRKWLENWYVWIAVDIIYVVLYTHKSLYLTAALYALFIGLCIAGLMSWRKSVMDYSSVSNSAPAE